MLDNLLSGIPQAWDFMLLFFIFIFVCEGLPLTFVLLFMFIMSLNLRSSLASSCLFLPGTWTLLHWCRNPEGRRNTLSKGPHCYRDVRGACKYWSTEWNASMEAQEMTWRDRYTRCHLGGGGEEAVIGRRWSSHRSSIGPAAVWHMGKSRQKGSAIWGKGRTGWGLLLDTDMEGAVVSSQHHS